MLLSAALTASPATRADVVSELDAIVASAGALSPQDLVELSRLIPDPTQQIRWLRARHDALDADAAERLLDLARARIRTWSDRGVSGLDRILDGIQRATPVPTLLPIESITDPAQLIAQLSQINPAELTDAQKFILLARGASRTALGLSTRRPAGAWDRPRDTLSQMVTNQQDRSFWNLLGTRSELSELRNELRAGAVPRATETVEIVNGFVSAGLGDRLDQAKWASLASTFESESLWTWAALARVLQAHAGARDAVAAARANLSHCTSIANHKPDSKSFVAAIEALIGQVQSPQPNGLLQPGSGDSVFQRRASAEQAFQAAWSAGNPDGIFQKMQETKAAGLGGAAAPPLPVDGVKNLFQSQQGASTYPRIHLFLEILAVTEGAGRRYYGLAIRSTSTSLDTKATWKVDRVGPENSAAALATKAMNLVSTAPWAAQVIVALDGDAYTPSGFREMDAAIFRLVTDGWVVYTPTAAALAPRTAWKIDRTGKLWLEIASAINPADARLSASKVTGPPVTRVLLPEISKFDTYLLSVSYPFPSFNPGQDALNALFSAKKRGDPSTSTIVPLIIGK